jgi:hypothetical protein
MTRSPAPSSMAASATGPAAGGRSTTVRLFPLIPGCAPTGGWAAQIHATARPQNGHDRDRPGMGSQDRHAAAPATGEYHPRGLSTLHIG